MVIFEVLHHLTCDYRKDFKLTLGSIKRDPTINFTEILVSYKLLLNYNCLNSSIFMSSVANNSSNDNNKSRSMSSTTSSDSIIYYDETSGGKLARKARENPFFPIGIISFCVLFCCINFLNFVTITLMAFHLDPFLLN